jgi:outer membrane protein OmpA-like peptidoglycan-associated protein
MKILKIILTLIISILLVDGCSISSKAGKNDAPGTATSGAVDVAASEIAVNPALRAIIKATVGGSAGIIIGRQMDIHAAELEQDLPNVIIERVGEGITVEFSSAVIFALNRSDLSGEAKAKLEKLVSSLNNHPDTNIEVQGHTDDTGSEAYNQTLSEKRAATVTLYLKQMGIEAGRIISIGYGELLPKYDNTTDEGRSMNRRVTFVITANEKMIDEAEKEAAK